MTETETVTIRMPEDSPYQVLPSLDENEYASLEKDIINNGIQEDVVIDEDGIPIDGYTRAKIALENDIDIPTTVREGLSEQEKRDLAYRLNLNRRHLEPGQKRQIVQQYLLEDWDGDNSDEWYQDIASKLGVGNSTVRKVFTNLRKDGKFAKFSIFSKDEERRQVKDYIEENPDASNREVAENIEAEVSHSTVGNWRNDWESEDTSSEPEQKEDDEEPQTFQDFSNQSDDDSVEVVGDPTDVTEESERTETASDFTSQIETVETVEVDIEDEVEVELEIPEKTHEKAESYASDFGFSSVEDLLLQEIVDYIESDKGTTAIIESLDTKTAKRGY